MWVHLHTLEHTLSIFPFTHTHTCFFNIKAGAPVEREWEISTNPNMSQRWKPSEGVAAGRSGFANQRRQNICCPIRASGTSGTNEQQSSSSWTLTLPTWLHWLNSFSVCLFLHLSSYFSMSIYSPAHSIYSYTSLSLTLLGGAVQLYWFICISVVGTVVTIADIPLFIPHLP